jgi:NAD(P)H-dependent FMN reductase
MPHIVIISSSVRIGRQSHKVALYFNKFIKEHQLATSEILDLKEFNFPVLEERLSFMPNPGPKEKLFSEKIAQADAVITVFPEYNGGYPASLKNAIDLLYNEWYHKPIGLACVSSGGFAGVNALSLIQTVFLKIRAVPVFPPFPVPTVQDSFDDEGNVISNKEATDKKAGALLKELLWFAEAFSKMN